MGTLYCSGMVQHIVRFFDRLEDRVRRGLSRHPVLCAFIGGVGVVLFWKGVWETAESAPLLHGPGSIILGGVILLVTGLLVSVFIGDSIIISGFTNEKKLAEKTAAEIEEESITARRILDELERIEQKLDHEEDVIR